jgi:membrane-associated phospholipid phosphatase
MASCLAIVSVELLGSMACGQTRQLRWDPALDVSITSIGAAAWVATEVFERDLVLSRCRWCGVGSVDAGIRNHLVWRDTTTADRISDVTAFVLTPLAVLGLDSLAASHDGSVGDVPEDVLVTAEATVLAEDVTQLTKLLVGRERPFVHPLPTEHESGTDDPSNNNVSFFSGHTSEVFALATASGTVSEMRGYRYAPLIWSAGGALAMTTAYLRIAADRHWFTDVVAGAIVGAGFGFATPYLFHSEVAALPTSGPPMMRPQTAPTTTLMIIPW